jgi:replication-associated recombination protein RarA
MTTARPHRRFIPWGLPLEGRLPLSTVVAAPAPAPYTYDMYEADMAAAADKQFDPSKVPPGVDPAHYENLPKDPATNAYCYDEANSALRVEKNSGSN